MTGQGSGGDDPVLRRRKKIFKIHFRNVSAPLPHFTETMIDDGYYDMSKIMRALVDVKFEGIVIPDHVPGLGATRRRKPAGDEAAGAEDREIRAQPRPGLLARLHELDAAGGAGQARLMRRAQFTRCQCAAPGPRSPETRGCRRRLL